MKICLLTRYFDFRNAGLGRFSMEIRNGLIKRGYDVDCISTEGESLYSYFSYTLFEIPIKLRKRKYDIQHALTPMEGIWLNPKRGIVTFHDLIQIKYPERQCSGLGGRGWKSFVGGGYFRFACNMASKVRHITCNSNQTKEDLIEVFKVKPEKITVTREGIREDLEPKEKPDEVFRIGYLGQLDRRKRVNLLIKAFERSRLDADLVIAGGGADSEYLRELARDDIRGIKFYGYIKDELLPDFYNSLDVFVFPTWVEGYGLPIVEAMACRKPVIVLSDAVIPSEIKDRCIVVDKLEDALWNIRHLESLCKDINYDSNYKFAKEHSWDRCVEEHIKLYEEIRSI